MLKHLSMRKILNYIVDEIFKLKRFTSPIDAKTKLRKAEYLKEQKYLQNFDFMIDTIEDCICVSPDASIEFERKKALDSDYLYFELCHKASTLGKENLTLDEISFLKNFSETHDIPEIKPNK